MKIKINLLILLVFLFIESACNEKIEKSGEQQEKVRIPVKVDVIETQEYEMIVEGIGKIDSRQCNLTIDIES